MAQTRLGTALACTAAVAATAGVGSVAVRVDSAWYRDLVKPAWQPPAAAFGPVWTVLYVTMAYTGARVLSRAGGRRRGTLVSLGVANLVLNAGWNVIFFRAHAPWAAVADTAVLTGTTVAFAAFARPVDRPAVWLLAPYAAWTGFATALTTAIALRN